eukprot:COSAG01_NODE_5843_length_4000_cov_16.903358_2_plen_152_part_00
MQTKLLQSNTVQEQVIVPPSCRAVLIALRQRNHHICACREELGRAGGGYNEMVTSMPSKDAVTKTDGQIDPQIRHIKVRTVQHTVFGQRCIAEIIKRRWGTRGALTSSCPAPTAQNVIAESRQILIFFVHKHLVECVYEITAAELVVCRLW